MTAILELDLDTPPTAAQAPAAPRARLPWILFALTLAVLALTLVTPRTPPPPDGMGLRPVPASSIHLEQSGGISPGPTVWRDADGLLLAVLHPVSPYNQETVTCRLVVDGQEVTAEGVDGFPAVCVWVRDAA
jgi:hypothetical protein